MAGRMPREALEHCAREGRARLRRSMRYSSRYSSRHFYLTTSMRGFLQFRHV